MYSVHRTCENAHLHDGLIVSVDQAAECLDHSKLDVIINMGHARLPTTDPNSNDHLHNGLIVSVDQVADCLNHSKLDVIVNLRHQPKVQDGKAAIWRTDQVAGVGVGTATETGRKQQRLGSTHVTSMHDQQNS
jgi:hypothetical protein